MATSGTNLRIICLDSSGDEITFNYKYADPEAQASDIRSLANILVTNGSVFQKTPATIKSAELVTTTVTPIAVDDVSRMSAISKGAYNEAVREAKETLALIKDRIEKSEELPMTPSEIAEYNMVMASDIENS